jgi:TetR/AcrR family transcriptional regulator, regulator of cefoperazone and chloramphenicol sensitivity
MIKNTTKALPDKADKKEALLDAAEKLFSEKGYAATGIREIAGNAGVNLALIQYHFGGKGQLFIAVVHRLLAHGGVKIADEVFAGVPAEREASAIALARFVRRFMHYLIKPERPQACRLMYREVLGDQVSEPEVYEALVSSVAERFAAPLRDHLVRILRPIRPQAEDEELRFTSQSILGQCVYYLTNRAFQERMRGQSLAEAPLFDAVAIHVASFSLRGLGCEEQLVERCVDVAFEDVRLPKKSPARGKKR